MFQLFILSFLFREVHDKFGMGDHKTKPYKTSPSPSSYDSDAENDDNW